MKIVFLRKEYIKLRISNSKRLTLGYKMQSFEQNKKMFKLISNEFRTNFFFEFRKEKKTKIKFNLKMKNQNEKMTNEEILQEFFNQFGNKSEEVVEMCSRFISKRKTPLTWKYVSDIKRHIDYEAMHFSPYSKEVDYSKQLKDFIEEKHDSLLQIEYYVFMNGINSYESAVALWQLRHSYDYLESLSMDDFMRTLNKSISDFKARTNFNVWNKLDRIKYIWRFNSSLNLCEILTDNHYIQKHVIENLLCIKQKTQYLRNNNVKFVFESGYKGKKEDLKEIGEFFITWEKRMELMRDLDKKILQQQNDTSNINEILQQKNDTSNINEILQQNQGAYKKVDVLKHFNKL